MSNKKIDTLVEDIYSLFTSEEKVDVSQDDLAVLAEEITRSVSFALTESRKQKKTLRLSLIGQPDRKIWYNLNKEDREDGEGLKGNDYIKFLYGNILESLLIFLCKAAGHSVTDQQKELKIEDIVGHQDARVDDVLVDFKSASSFSFKKFKEGAIFTDDPFGYIAQLSAYAHANKVKEAGFVVIDKSNGEITYCPVHQMEMINAEERINTSRRWSSLLSYLIGAMTIFLTASLAIAVLLSAVIFVSINVSVGLVLMVVQGYENLNTRTVQSS